jgi:hypothetical protein
MSDQQQLQPCGLTLKVKREVAAEVPKGYLRLLEILCIAGPIVYLDLTPISLTNAIVLTRQIHNSIGRGFGAFLAIL